MRNVHRVIVGTCQLPALFTATNININQREKLCWNTINVFAGQATIRSEGCILKSLRFVWLHWRLNTQLVIMIVSLNVCIATIIPGDSKHYGLQRGQLLLALVIKIIIRHSPSILVKTAPSFLLSWGQVWPYEALPWGPGEILQSM